MLKVITFWWGEKYPALYVQRLHASLKRHISEPFEFTVAVDSREKLKSLDASYLWTQIRDPELLAIRGCFARLRIFDPVFQSDIGINDRALCIDLDVVVTGGLDPMVCRPEPFLIFQGANAANPCPYNGSLWMVRAGYRSDVWSDFSVDAAGKVPFYEFPDDQGWLAHKIPNAAGWKAGSSSGVYGFQKPGWPKGVNDLPSGARLVAFFGKRDPSQFAHLDWVKKHWAA